MTTDNQTSNRGTPVADAFYLPADPCRQAQMWLPWPTDARLHDAVTAVAHAAADFAPVKLLVNPGQDKAARAACGGFARDMLALKHTSPRLRDIGPTFLVDGKGGSAAVDWRFDGWGKRGSADDAALAHELLGAAEVRRFRAPLTLEGSSFVADGHGTLLALSSAAFDPARNPNLGQLEAFGIFQNWLNVARVVWLPQAHPGDALNTDVRALASFVAPGAVAVTADQDNAVLARARDAQGKNLDLLHLPAPPPGGGARSYTNFVVVNGGVLMPAFDAPSDVRAADMLAEVFPGRVIRPVPAGALLEAGVTLTSLTLPHPARLLERSRAMVLPRSAWDQPTPDAEALLQKYIDMADAEN